MIGSSKQSCGILCLRKYGITWDCRSCFVSHSNAYGVNSFTDQNDFLIRPDAICSIWALFSKKPQFLSPEGFTLWAPLWKNVSVCCCLALRTVLLD